MDAHTLLEEWEASPFAGGFEGLRDLLARGVSGAVEARGSVLFLRDGDPLAVVEDLSGDPEPGDVDAFDGADGELHTARRPETATLAALLALDGDVRGQYFTEDTPLTTVHETLSEGGFTGYVELSENVLSGDYYVVYRDGREEYVAFVGSGDRLLVGEEARMKAEGEVGIYSVVGASLPGVELPTSTESGGTVEGGAASVGGASDGSEARSPANADASPAASPSRGTGTDAGEAAVAGKPDPSPDYSESPDGSVTGDPDAGSPVTGTADAGGRAPDTADATGSSADHPGSDPPSAGPTDGGDATAGPESSDRSTPEATGDESVDGSATAGDPADAADPSAGTSGTERTGTVDEPGPAVDDGTVGAPSPSGEGDGGSVVDAVSSRTVPSLDPQNSRRDSGDGGDENASLPAGSQPDREPASTTAQSPSSEDGEVPRVASGPPGDAAAPATGPDVDERVEAVREEYEARIEELRAELAELRDERDDLRRRLESMEAGADADGGGGRSLSPSEAIAATSLFVREGTRGGATLEDALDGRTDRETLSENVRVEYHTEFDDDGVTVEGRPFEEWLEGTAHYRFVRWVVVDLLFEIRATGSASSMRHLYDALPEVDRVGLRDGVAVGEDDDRREITFDVVARNRMGDPLFVATIDESREPTAGEAMEPLVTDASDVCEWNESLVGTFAVTSSYFEPAALDTVREATSGSLLGREKYRSYVKLSRKNGFHMCTVERREGSFHLTAPEL